MTDQVKGLRFDIYERIDLPDDVEGIMEWEEIELTPNIQLSTTESQAILHGHLLLTGAYIGENSRHSNRLEHAIPVEITLPLKRIANIDQVSVEIDNFDVELLSTRRINVNGVLSLGGVATENIDNQDHNKSKTDQSSEPSFVRSGEEKLGEAALPEPLLSDMMRKEKAAKKRSEDKDASHATEVSAQDEAANRLREQAKRDLLTSSLQEGISESERHNNVAEARDHDSRLGSDTRPVHQPSEFQQFEQQAEQQPSEQRENVQQATEHFVDQQALEQIPSAQPQLMDQMTVEPGTAYTSSLNTGHDADGRHSDVPLDTANYSASSGETPSDSASSREAPSDSASSREAPSDSISQLETAHISSAEAFTQQVDQSSTDQLFSDTFDTFEQAEDNTAEKSSEEIKIAFSSHKSVSEPSLEASDLQQQLAMQRSEGQIAEQIDVNASEADESDDEGNRSEAEQSDTPSTEWKSFLLNRDIAEERHFSKVRMCIVQKEDTLDTIADRYQLNPREIVLYNRLGDQELNEGQIVYIPNLSS